MINPYSENNLEAYVIIEEFTFLTEVFPHAYSTIDAILLNLKFFFDVKT